MSDKDKTKVTILTLLISMSMCIFKYNKDVINIIAYLCLMNIILLIKIGGDIVIHKIKDTLAEVVYVICILHIIVRGVEFILI